MSSGYYHFGLCLLELLVECCALANLVSDFEGGGIFLNDFQCACDSVGCGHFNLCFVGELLGFEVTEEDNGEVVDCRYRVEGVGDVLRHEILPFVVSACL